MARIMKGLTLGLAVLSTAGAQFIQQGSKLVGSGGNSFAQQGSSVALSADGNTAAVGGLGDGSVWVFTRAGGVWTQQGSKLVGSGAEAMGTADLGFSIAISADGNTIISGSPVDNGRAGAAWIFVRSGGVWTQQGNKLVASNPGPTAAQGWSVAISGDGNTALVGAPQDSATGAVFVYTRTAGVWTQQAKLVGSGVIGRAAQGNSVSISADGNTALIGGYQDNNFGGAAWVFTRSGGAWTQQGNKLVGNGTTGAADQAFAVALSADGNTAIIGAPTDQGTNGSAIVFMRTNGVWTQQGSKLTGSGVGPLSGSMSAGQGTAVALSADGNIALVGGPHDEGESGATWVFRRSGGIWKQYGNKLLGSGAVGGISQRGSSVALSAGGSTALIGAPHDAGIGAAWVFTVPHIRDFNADAWSDALMYDFTTGTAFTALSHGDGSFSYVYNLFSPGFDVLRTGDFNGDGRKDLVVYNTERGSAYIGMSKGDGTFNFQSLFLPAGLSAIETGDLNGDGKTDIVLHNSGTGVMFAGISDGTNAFAYRSVAASTSGRTMLAVADFTGDGKADVLLYSPANGNTHLGISDGAGGFTFVPVFANPGHSEVITGDLNGDGNEDVLLYNSTLGYASAGISDRAGGFSFHIVSLTYNLILRLADFTGDGKADLVVYNTSTGLASFGTGNGDGTFGFQTMFQIPGYNSWAAQDFNGDLKSDLLLYNPTTGTAYSGISNGDGTFTWVYSLWRKGQIVLGK